MNHLYYTKPVYIAGKTEQVEAHRGGGRNGAEAVRPGKDFPFRPARQ